MNTRTEFVVLSGQNLPNHSESLRGRGKFVRINGHNPNNSVPLFRTRQEAYRLAAHLLCAAQGLPIEDEEPSTWDEVLEAVMEETNTLEFDAIEEVTENGNEGDEG